MSTMVMLVLYYYGKREKLEYLAIIYTYRRSKKMEYKDLNNCEYKGQRLYNLDNCLPTFSSPSSDHFFKS